MPTTYGAWTPSGSANKRMRLRIDHSVTVSGQIATVSGGVYVEAGNRFWDSSNDFAMGGTLGPSASGSRSINVATGGAQLIQTFSQQVPLGTSPQTRTLTASLSGIGYIGDSARATVAASIDIPAGATATTGLPNTPWDVTVIRHSDTRHELRWTVTAPTGKPIDDVVIQRWSRRSTTGWQAVAVIPGAEGTRAWIDNTTRENDWYIWRIITRNARGSAPPAESAETPTSPAPPSGVTLTRNPAGDIIVTWSRNAPLAPRQDVQMQSSPDGLVWDSWRNVRTHLADSVTQVAVSGLDGTRLWRARVQAVVNAEHSWGVGTSQPSAPVQPLTPPAPPTLLGPTRTQSSQEPVTWVWRHNPKDHSAQTGAQLRHRPVGSSSWAQTLTVWRDAQQLTSAAPLVVGPHEWQVRTKGAASDWGDWSPISTLEVADPPTVSITKPAQQLHSNRMSVEFAYHDGTGAAMVGWVCQLWRGGLLLEETTGTGHPSAITLDSTLQDQVSYRLTLVAISGTGLRSVAAEVDTRTSFLPPPTPTLIGEWVEVEGLARLSVTNPSKGPRQDAVDHNRIERSIDGGRTWQTIADGLGIGPDLNDNRVPLNQAAAWRAVAVTPLGVEAISDELHLATPSQWVWLVGEDGTGVTLRHNLGLSREHGHHRVVEHYLGRGSPEVHWGEGRPTKVAVSGALIDGHGIDQDLSLLLGRPLHYRDPEGVALWIALSESGIQISQRGPGIRQISLSGEAVEHDAQ